jgi:hypothetical protein
MKILNKIMFSLLVSVVFFVNGGLASASSDIPSVSIKNYMQNLSTDLLSRIDDINIKDGNVFHEDKTHGVSILNINSDNLDVFRFKYNELDQNFQGTVSENLDKEHFQSYRYSLQNKSSLNKLYGNGTRFIIDANTILFQTEISEFDRYFSSVSTSYRVDIVQLSSKKVYSLTMKVYQQHKGEDTIHYQNIRSIFTYQDNLIDNDFISILLNGKDGVSTTNDFYVNSNEVNNKYGEMTDGMNTLPLTYDILINTPYLYIYEIFSQFKEPIYKLHCKDAFYIWYNDKMENDIIDKGQIDVIQEPFSNKSIGQ